MKRAVEKVTYTKCFKNKLEFKQRTEVIKSLQNDSTFGCNILKKKLTK